MHTDRSGGKADGASGGEASAQSSPGSLLLIASSVDAPPLREVVEWASAGACDLTVAPAVDAAGDLLGRDPEAVILLDLAGGDGPSLPRVVEIARDATLIVRGGDAPTADAPVARWLADSDSAAAIIGCIRDALERRALRGELRATTAALEESEGRFRSIVGRTADGIVIVGPNGRVMFANGGAERMFARTAADLVGRDFGVPLVSGETAEMDIVRSAGTEPIVAELGVSATTWEGSAAQIISLRDITDRKHAEERAQRLLLEQSAREQAEEEGKRARLLADASAALDASMNAERTLAALAQLVVPRVSDWCVIDLLEGERVRRIAGLHSDPTKQPLLEELAQRYLPLIGSPQPCARVLGSNGDQLHVSLDAAGLRAIAVDEGHADLLARLGTRSIMSVPLETRDRCIGAITFVCGERDFDEGDVALAGEIASRAAHALDSGRLFESALMANRVKSDFLAVMSHELRTPLTAILGYADLMLEGVAGKLSGGQEKYIRRIRAGGARLLEIVQEILMYAEMEAGRAQARPREITLGELIDEVVAIAEPLVAEKGLALRLEVE